MQSLPGVSALIAASRLCLARSVRESRPSILQEVVARASCPGVLSFALGMPASELFPAAELAAASRRVLTADPGALQYAAPYLPLKEQIVELMAARGVSCRREQIFLTAGAQQAMHLLSRLLLDPGGQVMFEDTVYEGLRVVLRTLEPKILTVPTDPETGLDADAVETHLAHGARPAFLYVMPEGHNPIGSSMSLEKRRRLLRIARDWQLPVMEDDAYGFLSYDDTPPPALRAHEEDWVFYLGSFSKILAPGLRVGWMVVPEELIPRLSTLKQGTDIDVTNFSQRIVSAYLETGHLPSHLERIRHEYRRRRDTMLAALARHLPAEARFTRPRGGLYIWVELPAGADTVELFDSAIRRQKVAFTPGLAFVAGGGRAADNCLRLCFASVPTEEIERGVERLAEEIHRHLAERARRRIAG